jgi:hypothetical protein
MCENERERVGNWETAPSPDVHQRDKISSTKCVEERKMHLVDLRLSKSEGAMILVIGDSAVSRFIAEKVIIASTLLKVASFSMCFCEKSLLANLIRSVYSSW